MLTMRVLSSFKPLFLVLLVSASVLATVQQEESTSPMESTEQEALYSIFRSMVGKWFNGTHLYPDPCGWTPIQGVTCDLFNGLWYATAITIGRGHDSALECSENAKFDPRFFELKHLKSLSFLDCFHRPLTIPDSLWADLSRSLQTLEFRSNPGLTGRIPEGFSALRKLQSLVLLENNLTGELPTGLGDVAELRQLVLAGNRLQGGIPASLGNLKKLLIMDLSRNSLSGPLPATLGEVASLVKLDLSNNSLGGVLPEKLGHLKNLTLLDLTNNRFAGGLPRRFSELGALEEMLMANNPIGGDLAGLDWNRLQNLIILDFSNMGLQGCIPESMAEMKRLRFLALDNNNLSGNVPANLESMPSVNALHLNGNDLAGELQFTEGFYGKMGRHFAVWSNPNLCYNGEVVPKGNGPYGVRECQRRADVVVPNTKSYVEKEEASTHHGSCGLRGGSCAFSGSGVVSRVWWVIVLTEMVILLLACVLL